jgi:hypothetical protein
MLSFFPYPSLARAMAAVRERSGAEILRKKDKEIFCTIRAAISHKITEQ